ncbi:MAG: ISNCY family transposase [Chloroflexi bacterium]|nr:ISNCY family transposase [Chloroflexota bacterium]MCI0579546.1 ISNCY family transposase [Chloroflexota bacterium]MCI0647515.1 ISNCY family transposase [Chloroflexota bacterium]MCI0730826.1 ISNCY family transposase [Chloroflexota bacterium]
MSETLSLSHIVERFQARWQSLPDHRQASNNTQYEIADAAASAFSVFFMQSPSFLAHQRDMHQRKGRDNVATLFGVKKIPSDNQIGNLLDPIRPGHFQADFEWVVDELAHSGHLASFEDYQGTYLITFDGVVFHSSEKIFCEQCSRRQDRSGQMHYYHRAITPVMVKPDSPHVLSLPPEFIVPQDGQEKQDCERAAVKRWLERHHHRYPPRTVTFLGDDLHANQPLCALIDQPYQQFFVFVAKPDSHTTLYEWIASLEGVNGLATHQIRRWNGRHGELYTYRFVNQVPLRAGEDALLVNWLELTITHEKSGEVLYHNAWVTNHLLTTANVAHLAKVGRTRWKVENENINVLKTKGYNLNHNFGHGSSHLANVFFSLNLLAFLVHTALHLVNKVYRLLRDTLAVRRTFFNDLKALTRYIVFDSWESLFSFMLDGLELTRRPELENQF